MEGLTRRRAPRLVADSKPYRPRGSALDLMRCRDEEAVFEGPAGTGKSLACLNLTFLRAMRYAGSRHLLVRKTRASLTESALVTLESEVVPAGHPMLQGAGRASRQSYTLPNGSVIVTGGLDKASRIMSTQWDTIYVQEAIELDEAEWEALSTRLRGGTMPYTQMLGDTNPDRPSHWLNVRCNSGRTRRLLGRHEDNPLLYGDDGKLTPKGAAYLARLDRLTGARLQRMRYGRWAASEGIVYESWDPAAHMVARAILPRAWTRIWTVDFGYTNPFVWICWAVDPDGRLWLEWQMYRTKTLVEDAARMILTHLQAHDSPRPSAVVCDHDAEDRATLERHLSIRTAPASKAVSPGIQAVESRLRRDGSGRSRVLVMRDSLIHAPDPDLVEGKRPTRLEEEFDGYVWDVGGGRRRGEQPLKADDHGMDALRYGVAYVDLRDRRRVVGLD